MLAAHAAKRFDFGIEISTGWEILSTAARILAQDHPNPGLFQAFFPIFEGNAYCRYQKSEGCGRCHFQRDDGHSYSSYLISFLPVTFHDSSPDSDKVCYMRRESPAWIYSVAIISELPELVRPLPSPTLAPEFIDIRLNYAN
jgi:hypothetical protein